MVALPAVLVPLKFMSLMLLMVALPAVLVPKKLRMLELVMAALPAVLAPEKLQDAGVVGDGGAAAVNDDAGAIEQERYDCL